MELEQAISKFEDYLESVGISKQSFAAYTTPFKKILNAFAKRKKIFDFSIDDIENALIEFAENESFREEVSSKTKYNWKKVIEYAQGFVNEYRRLTVLAGETGKWIIKCSKFFSEPIYAEKWEETKHFIKVETHNGKIYYLNPDIIALIQESE